MIKANGLGQRFGTEAPWIFRGVSFQVPQGGSLAILGPSGAGKTLCLKMLAGLLTPTEGWVNLGTHDVGMLFQKNALFDSLTVLENLLFPLRERRGIRGPEADRRARELLEAVGLAHAGAQFPDELSGGMQKRLGIARALIVEPELLLVDEPTAGLDPITSRQIADLLDRLRRARGTTTVVVTNDIARAMQLGETVALLGGGRLTAPETPEQMRANPDPAVRQFLAGALEGPLTSGLA